MHDYKKIFVIRFSSLGDVILTLPLIKVLKEKFPESEIDYLTKASYSDILKINPSISKFITVDDELDYMELKELRKKLANEKYDLVIDLHNNLRTFYLKFFLKRHARIITFKKYSIRKFLLVKFKINLMKNLPPIYMRYIQTLQKIRGISLDTSRIELTQNIYTDSQSKQNLELILKENNIPANKRLICIVPGSKHFTKTYPTEYYAGLINKFDKEKYSVILVGKGKDKEIINSIKSQCDNNVYDFCNKLSLIELAELVKKCSLVIGGDTGPIHIAEAFNIPLLMIAGSSVREFGFYPQSERAIILENNNLKCRPCSHIGRDKCPKVHFKCMKEITDEMVLERLTPTLSKGEFKLL